MIDFYNYIYKYFKLSIISTILLLIYIVAYIDGVVAHSNNVYISDSYLLEHQIKYTKAMYGLNKEEPFKTKYTSDILNIDDKYNSIKYNFSIVIDNLGISESLFAFPMTYNIEDYEYVNSKKLDSNMIDFELMEVADIKKWFMIGGHSSGLILDDSNLKKVFNSLDLLKLDDKVQLVRSDWFKIEYKVVNRSIKDLDETIMLSNKFYVYTCYPVGSTDQRLIIELEEIM